MEIKEIQVMVLKKIKRVKQGQNNDNHNNKRPLDQANTIVKMEKGVCRVKVRRDGVISGWSSFCHAGLQRLWTRSWMLPGWAWILPWVLKAEKERKPMGDWSLKIIKNKQAGIHLHTQRGNYPIISINPTQYLFLSLRLPKNNSYNRKELKSGLLY